MSYSLEKVKKVKKPFPFDKMKVMDSFVEKDSANLNNLRVQAHNYSKLKKVKFTIKKDGTGYRCTRVK